jgi:hypothetical protein
MFASLPTQTYQGPAVQPVVPTGYGSSYGSVPSVRSFDTPVAPTLPPTEADIFCKGKRPESIFPIGDGEKYIVCIMDGKGHELFCPKDLIWDVEKGRCERRIKLTKNLCDLQPCLHGGQCFPTEYSYQCKCAQGFEGLTCELDARVCQTQQPCGVSGALCQSFHVNAALRHVCILEDGLSYGLTGQQVHRNPCLERDGFHPLAFSDKGYISCNGEKMYVHSCPGGTIWSEFNKVCVWPDMQDVPKPVDMQYQQAWKKPIFTSPVEFTRPIERPIERPVERPIERPIERLIERPVERLMEEPLTRPFVSSYGGQLERPIEKTLVRPIEKTLVEPIEKTFVQPQYSSYGSKFEVTRPMEKTFVQPTFSSYGGELERPIEKTLVEPIEKTFVQPQYSSYGSKVEVTRPMEKTFVQPTFSSYGSQVPLTLPKVIPVQRFSGY